MATAKEVPQFVKASLRSVLLCQKGLNQTSIQKEYKKLTHSELDVKKYGYRDLYEFLLALPDVARLEYSVKDGENRVFGVAKKGVYISDHAKKAEGIPNGLKPLPPSEWPRNKAKKERTVAEDKSPLKVTEESDDKRRILPDTRGLYALHIKNFPPNCQENEISRIFKQFQSLKEVKIESSIRVAFVRFSNYADALRALGEMDGYNLRGFSLIVNPATQRVTLQNTKDGKGKKEDSKDHGTKRNKNTSMVNGIENNKTFVKDTKLGSGMDSSLSSPKENRTVVQAESWETDGWLSPKTPPAENMKFFSQDDVASRVNEEDGSFPVHVSNFPVGTTKETLRQLFSACGEIAQINLKEKFAFIYFTKREGAETALQKMAKTLLGDKILTVTPKTPKGKPKKQNSSPVAPSSLNCVSSQSLVSSNDSLTPQSPTSLNNSGSACSSRVKSNGHTHTDQCHVKDRGLLVNSSGQQKESCSNAMDTSNSMNEHKEERKLEENKTASSSLKSLTEGNKEHISLSMKQSVPVHLLLTYEEMCELLKRCNKPLTTSDNIGAQEFDILVTDVIDSCHFWANVDDQRGSYKELRQIQSDLQIVEHHKRCMPLKYQLGASLFSEDKCWYRCWCLEVSNTERKEAKVFYIDYGNCEWISWDRFTDIHKRFWDLAPQAVPFKLAGLENATDVSPKSLNEGSEYLKALIINKVCKARISQSSDAKRHVMEVELTVTSGDKSTSIQVNKQMALTRYVQETRKAPHVIQEQQQNQSFQEFNQPAGSQQQMTVVRPKQPANQMPPQASINTQNAQVPQAQAPQAQTQAKVPQAMAQHVRWPVDQEPLPSKEAQHNQQLPERSQANFQKNPAQTPQNVQVNKQLPNQNTEPVEKSLPQQLPSGVYQLFEKKEVMDVFLSYVDSRDGLYLFSADEKTKERLQVIARTLKNEAKPEAKIYPRVGEIVTRINETPSGEQKMHRVRIKSILKSNAIGVDEVVVQNVDYGYIDKVKLSCLCELPASLRQHPTHVKQAKLAGIQKKSGSQFYPEIVINKLVRVKTKKKALKASVVKRQEDGVLLVELFESEGPSLNVQLLRTGHVQLDKSLQHLYCYPNSAGMDSSGISQTQASSGLPVTTNQTPRWQPHRLDPRPVDVQSNHSDWEENLLSIATEWMEDTPVTGAHGSEDQLYMPPTPQMHSPSSKESGNTVPFGFHPASASGSASSLSALAGRMPLDPHSPSLPSASPSVLASSIPANIGPPSCTGTLSSLHHDRDWPSSTSLSSSSSSPGRAPSDEGPPSTEGSVSNLVLNMHARSSSGSESGSVKSHTSLEDLSGAVQKLSVIDADNRTALNKEEKTKYQDKISAQKSLEKEQVEPEDAQDWWQEKMELIQKDEELTRILEMSRSEMMKMISLKQEKEKLERKIRMKGIENQILKLQKELKQLESEKEKLAGLISLEASDPSMDE